MYTPQKDTHRKRERRINLVGEERIYLFRDGREEHSFFFVFFVGGDREVRRYLFHSYLPRLNSNDLKFLYEVNTETRKLIKRSTRARDLKKRFKVEEMSSISTLEFAWENKSLWPDYWDETYFCREVAETNKLELLKWAREEKKCEWDEGRLMRPQNKVIWKWSSIAWQMKCPIDSGRVHVLPKTVISSASNTYAKKPKRLGIRVLPLGRLQMVISTYSNILLSVSMMNIRICV